MDKLTENSVERIYSLIYKGIESWIEAGALIAKEIDSDPDFVDKFCDKHSDISPETVVRFELIGRRKLHPRTLLTDAPGMRRLRKLPYSLQEKYVTDPIKLVVKQERGYDLLMVDVRNLTPEQAAQAFDSNGVRSEAAQRAWIEDRIASRLAPSIETDMPYRITGRKVVFLQPCTMSISDLASILAKVER